MKKVKKIVAKKIKARANRLSWDECFMKMAHIIADRSPDPSTQTGAVVVDNNNIVLGMGYNGWPRGIKTEDLPWDRDGNYENTKYAYVCHSEENAIYNASKSTNGCKMYCTLFPCNECVKAIIQNGIKEIIYENDKYADLPAWKASKRMLKLAGVTFRQYQHKS
jgi:dCMP deaminase